MWLKIKQEGQTAGFGPCFHLPIGFHFGTGFLSHSHILLPIARFFGWGFGLCHSENTTRSTKGGQLGFAGEQLEEPEKAILAKSLLALREWEQVLLNESSSRSPSNWCPFTVSFFWEGSPTKIDYRQKGTLSLTSLLEDLVFVLGTNEAQGLSLFGDGNYGEQTRVVATFRESPCFFVLGMGNTAPGGMVTGPVSQATGQSLQTVPRHLTGCNLGSGIKKSARLFEVAPFLVAFKESHKGEHNVGSFWGVAEQIYTHKTVQASGRKGK